MKYKRGKDLIIADALSRAYLNELKSEDNEFDKELETQVCLIKTQINITDNKIKEFEIETEKDNDLQELKRVILEGWPNNGKKLSNNLKMYSPYKSELTIIR